MVAGVLGYWQLDSPVSTTSRFRSALAVIAMLILTEAVYMRPEILLGKSPLLGSDRKTGA